MSERWPAASGMDPHPEHEMARRITQLESRGFPDVIVWTPLSSQSGLWEAQGKDWLIKEKSPLRFCDLLEARLSQMDPA